MKSDLDYQIELDRRRERFLRKMERARQKSKKEVKHGRNESRRNQSSENKQEKMG